MEKSEHNFEHHAHHGQFDEHGKGPEDPRRAMGERDWRGRHGRGGFRHEPGNGEHRGHLGGLFGGRARRGEVRYVLLDVLRNGPKHGYEIVKSVEERSNGQYVPSPGTVYPTMQYLQDEGFVSVDQDGDRRVFQLTAAGKAELERHAAEVEGFWARFEVQGVERTLHHEMHFLEEDIDNLNRTIWGGLHESIEHGDTETIRRVRQIIERCRNEVRNAVIGDPAVKSDV